MVFDGFVCFHESTIGTMHDYANQGALQYFPEGKALALRLEAPSFKAPHRSSTVVLGML